MELEPGWDLVMNRIWICREKAWLADMLGDIQSIYKMTHHMKSLNATSLSYRIFLFQMRKLSTGKLSNLMEVQKFLSVRAKN